MVWFIVLSVLLIYLPESKFLATTQSMGKEQFLGFYLSAGIVSSLASHVFKTALRMPGISLGAVI